MTMAGDMMEGVSGPSRSRELCLAFSVKQYCLAIHMTFNYDSYISKYIKTSSDLHKEF